jgi:hypothetical protein
MAQPPCPSTATILGVLHADTHPGIVERIAWARQCKAGSTTQASIPRSDVLKSSNTATQEP